MTLRKNYLESEEEILGLQLGKPYSYTWYELDKTPVAIQSIGAEDRKSFLLIIELDHETTVHKRQIYSALDMLGDVGGLLDGLKLLGSGVMFLFHLIRGDPLQDFLMKTIFKKGKEESKDVDLS